MKRVRFRNDSPRTKGIDESIWRRVSAILTAVSEGDSNTFVTRALKFSTSATLPQQRLAGYYVLMMIRIRLFDQFGRKPTEPELSELARLHFPTFATFLTMDEDVLRATYLISYQLVPEGAIDSKTYTVSSLVALGVLLDDPKRDLINLHEPVDAWCMRHADSLRAMTTDWVNPSRPTEGR